MSGRKPKASFVEGLLEEVQSFFEKIISSGCTRNITRNIAMSKV
jgi:hypothetical protein